ncbi:MAG: hypothetical protein WCJ45_04170 [bacterium]
MEWFTNLLKEGFDTLSKLASSLKDAFTELESTFTDWKQKVESTKVTVRIDNEVLWESEALYKLSLIAGKVWTDMFSETKNALLINDTSLEADIIVCIKQYDKGLDIVLISRLLKSEPDQDILSKIKKTWDEINHEIDEILGKEESMKISGNQSRSNDTMQVIFLGRFYAVKIQPIFKAVLFKKVIMSLK